MPNSETFSVPPIGDFVNRYLRASSISVDPFARNSDGATFTNDLNPDTYAHSHMDAEDFLNSLTIKTDLLLFDPPYSPRQISECYRAAGKTVGMEETQNSRFYKRIRDAAMRILSDSAIVLSFGWNSSGMGKERGFEIIEILMVCHGGAHNDTICLAEKRLPQERLLL